jgi:hypothetical protein
MNLLPLHKYNEAKDCQKQAKGRTWWSSLDLACHSWSLCRLSAGLSSRSTHELFPELHSPLPRNAFPSLTLSCLGLVTPVLVLFPNLQFHPGQNQEAARVTVATCYNSELRT